MKLKNILNTNFILLLTFSLFILISEPFIVNYEPGHFGWVSLHSLAIAKNTRPENFLLGYACEFEDGFLFYFSRYSIVFNIFTKYLLKFFEFNSALHLYLSRQLMNIIYIAIMCMMFLIAKKFLHSNVKAFIAALLSGSGFITLRYKNMYHFDQPGLLAFFVFILILTTYDLDYINKNRRKFLTIIFLLSMLGRCHIIIVACLVWTILEIISLITKDESERIKIKKNLLSSIFALLISSFSIGISIAYNLYLEAFLNNARLFDTSIFESARERLGLLPESKNINNWMFFQQQVDRFFLNFISESLKNLVFNYHKIKIIFITIIALSFLFMLIYIFAKILLKKGDKARQEKIFLITLVTGPIWLFVMKYLTWYHDYTAIYYLGTYLMFWVFIMDFLQINTKKYQPILLTISFVFIVSIANIKNLNTNIENPINYNALDVHINFLKAENYPSVYMNGGYCLDDEEQCFIKGSPYAMCYFLSPSKLSRKPELADFKLLKEGATYLLLKNK